MGEGTAARRRRLRLLVAGPVVAAGLLAALTAAPAQGAVPAAEDGSSGLGGGLGAAVAPRGAASPRAVVRPAVGPVLSIDATTGRHAISAGIYGMSYLSGTTAAASGATLDRWGGNSTSRYNYLNDTYNTGSDWYYENIVAGTGDRLTDRLAFDRARRLSSVVTVPMTGWVAKASPSSHPFTCGFPRSLFAVQDSFDPWDSGCGNGVRNGTALTPESPATTSVAAGPAFAGAMVSSLVGRYGTAAKGGVRYYSLDNEPALWNSTHRDVHPAAVTYDELAAKSTATAAAVKAADPSALVLGPGDWGWCAWFYSAADGCSPGADRAAHGGLDLAPWYLAQMRAYANAHGGRRVLDLLDEHYYPQASGVALSTAGSAATQALRLRSTRSLWDPRYVDESWIGRDVGAPPIALIPRMRAWAATYYPGTRLAITEYNFGGLESLNGALTQADVLGIFGREGLALAALWGAPGPGQPGTFAFRLYRNYDGRGHGFGGTSVRAVSADQGRLSVYAARRASDSSLTVVVINKTARALTSRVRLAHVRLRSTAVARWTYSAADLHRIVRRSNVAATSTGLITTFPANSATMLVLPLR